jgi:N-acyl-phosphatidylethanolamine-hydrolysing phospholipase D
MIPIWRGGTLSFIARLGSATHLTLSSLRYTQRQGKLSKCTLSCALTIRSLFATLAGSGYEALDPIVELELAKHAMVGDKCGKSSGKRG